MAEVQGLKEVVLIDPVALVDQLLAHEHDLPGSPTEAQKSDASEDTRHLFKGWSRHAFPSDA